MSATNSNSSTNNNEKLLKSVREQRLEEVKECLKSKCSLTYTDWAGHSSLHYASMNGNIEIASLLIRNGANINQLSKLNKIPLHFAAQNGHLDLAKLLITNGSSLNTLDILKMTPLHWAVERNYIEIARLLSSQPKKKLNTSQVDIFNRTIKVIAMKNGVKEIIELVDELMSRSELDGEDDELELAQMESRFKSSSLQKQTSIGIEPPNIDNIPGLKEFYKKKCFAKSSSSSFMSHLSLKSTNNTMPQTSGLTISGKKSIEKEATFDTESSDEDEDDNDEILEEKEIAKRKRLSMSPMNRIDDTLKWIKSQPSNDSSNFSNFQFSLTEAGKKTLDFLNKNDPIMEEKRLFLKLVKDLEDEEKSNQEKMSISAGSSPRSQDPGGAGGVHGGDLDDLLFF